MRQLTVAKLREMLTELPDLALVVISNHDHGYREAFAEVTTMMVDGRDMIEDHGEEYTPEGEYGKRVNCLVVS